jgi:WD40 repeat protein
VMTQLLYQSATMGATGIARQLATQVPEQGIATMWATSDSPLRLSVNPVRGHSSQVTSLAVTSDATRAFSASADGTTRVWRLASGRVTHEKPAPEKLVGLYATPDAPMVVAAAADGTAQLLDADTGERLTHVTSRRVATVTAFAVATEGTWGVSGDLDGNATVWDLTAGEPALRLLCSLGVITSVAVTPDARTAAVASRHGEIVVWDLVTGTRLAGLRHPGAVNALALTPDSGRLLVCGDELLVHDLTAVATPTIARLVPNDWVTAVAVNPLMPTYALIGTAFGQVAYLRLPEPTTSHRRTRSPSGPR